MSQTKFHIDFMSKRRNAVWLSGALIVLSLLSLAFRGLDLGIDFTGGVLLEVSYDQPVALDKTVRPVLDNIGIHEAEIVHFNTAKDVSINISLEESINFARTQGDVSADSGKPTQAMLNEKMVKVSDKILHALQQNHSGSVTLQRVDFVGPKVGKELTEDGGLALLYALLGILLYVAFRFEYRFALGSVAALVHDIIITLGFFALFQVDVDLTVLAALLAVIGYSLNDTIVVFDRIRENFIKMRKGTSEEVINNSLNQTLSRTLTTSFTTLLVLAALFLLGGKVMHGFSTALIIGIVVGTYSSIYVASATALFMGISKADLMPPIKEGQDNLDEDQSSV